jgi:hypothetical protein
MNTHQCARADERTVAVENASYKWAYTFVTIALFIDVMCRAVVFHEAAWDLMALAIVPAIACTIYQARQRIWGQGRVWKLVFIGLLAGVIGFIVAAIAAMILAIK